MGDSVPERVLAFVASQIVDEPDAVTSDQRQRTGSRPKRDKPPERWPFVGHAIGEKQHGDE